MNDPFAMLNPIDKPKTAPVYGGPPAAPVAPLHPVGQGFGGPTGMGMNMGMGMGMGMNMGMGGGMPGGMGMNMGGMGPQGMGPQGMGVPGMGPPGMDPPGMSPQGMGHPAMGMGMAPPGGIPPQQAPIMYDNIKNLLEQKPKPSGAMRDDTGMDFLENLGTAKAHSLSVSSPTSSAAVDPFGGPAPPPHAPTISVAGFTFPGETTPSTTAQPTTVSPSGGAKSSALADRLANGRRKTQEAQRMQLDINAGAFSQPSTKISLKEMAPSSSGDRGSRAPSLEDFASGKQVFQEADPFGISSSGSSSRTGSSGNSQTAKPTKPTHEVVTSPHASAFDADGGAIFADSDADFEKKLNSNSSMSAATITGSARQLSSGSLGTTTTRTGSGGATAKATMDFGW